MHAVEWQRSGLRVNNVLPGFSISRNVRNKPDKQKPMAAFHFNLVAGLEAQPLQPPPLQPDKRPILTVLVNSADG